MIVQKSSQNVNSNAGPLNAADELAKPPDQEDETSATPITTSGKANRPFRKSFMSL